MPPPHPLVNHLRARRCITILHLIGLCVHTFRRHLKSANRIYIATERSRARAAIILSACECVFLKPTSVRQRYRPVMCAGDGWNTPSNRRQYNHYVCGRISSNLLSPSQSRVLHILCGVCAWITFVDAQLRLMMNGGVWGGAERSHSERFHFADFKRGVVRLQCRRTSGNAFQNELVDSKNTS